MIPKAESGSILAVWIVCALASGALVGWMLFELLSRYWQADVLAGLAVVALVVSGGYREYAFHKRMR